MRAALLEAIQRAREADVLGPLLAAVEQPGFHRRLLGRFAAWIRQERPADGPAPGRGPSEVAQWALFRRFAETLLDIDARTPEGFAAWASARLVEAPPPGWRDLGRCVVGLIEPVDPTPAVRRALAYLQDRAGAMVATLPHDPEPALAELYAAVEPTRRLFLDLGFAEEAVPDRPDAPHGLVQLDRELFRADAHLRPKLEASGLEVLGGPKGDGLALLVARRVASALGEGVEPDDVLILTPAEDDDAASIRATLASWGLPVAPGPTRRPATTPAIAALRLAIRLPVEGYETATLARLLRHGAVDWDRLDLDGHRRFEAAAALVATRVYRDRDRLRRALDRARNEVDPKSRQFDLLVMTRGVLDRIADRVDRAARPGPYRDHLGRLRELAAGLGLDADELAPLWDAIEDHAGVIDRVGPAIAALPIRWADFVAQVEAIVAEAEPAPPDPARLAGTVRVEPVGAVDGARAAVVILANLAEKTFPSPDAVPLGPAPAKPDAGPDTNTDPLDVDPADARQTDLSYALEMLRFARAIGSADSALVLAHPTTDASGEGLLPAGFLDEILRRLDPAAAARVVEEHRRFDPVLRGHEGLARADGDARVLAVARAMDGDIGSARDLAARPAHAEAFRGVAEAFRVGHARRERQDFNGHDGWLMDPDAIARVAADFGPDHTFSPSQLETYAACPYQFFARYALGLKPTDPAEELAEDYAGRGRDVHAVLEQVHLSMQSQATADLAASLPIYIETEMRVKLDQFDRHAPPGEADVAEVLREINTRRSGKALERYLAQFRAYDARAGAGATPHRFEVKFGQPDKPDSLDHLILGDADRAIKLQGVVDRIDLVATEAGPGFRIIDYKTGSHPSPADVKSGLASQLPLYAMAVERLVLADGHAEFLDAGYWSLPGKGFQGVKLGDWADFRERVVEFVLALVGELRRGVFPIHSQDRNCHQRCDFGGACRVKEVRRAGKAWDDRPAMEGPP